MSVFRTRVGLFLTALSVIALELALMRALSLRFWHHLAALVIGAAMLGVGASGTAISLLRRWIAPHPRGWLAALAVAFAVSIPLSLWASGQVSLDVEFLAWDLSRLGDVALLELVMFVPFFLSAGVLGVALMDRPDRIGGHYAANLIGSGVGAVGCVAAMHVLDISQLVVAVTATALLAGAVLTPWRRVVWASVAVLAGVGIAVAAWFVPYRPTVSQYKPLSGFLNLPDTRILHHAEGPAGQIDVVAGPAIHYAPPMSLQYFEPPPPHVLLIVDADRVSGVYNVPDRQAWLFMDYTTAAMPYHIRNGPSVLILGAGGGEDIGLALFHHSRDVVAIESSRQVIDMMTGPLADSGGGIYRADGVTVVHAAGRGYLAASDRKFDVIQLSAAGAGVTAARESYLCTVEAVDAMLDRLSRSGLLCLTTPARTPPREGLRMFHTAATALRQRGVTDPGAHLAMIRGPATASILVSPRPLDAGDRRKLRAFCDDRSFDLCHLPGLTASEANQYNQLDQPYYHQGTAALLGEGRDAYIDNYLFDLTAPTDERPFFFHFFKWRAMASLSDQIGAQSRAYLELGYLILLAALVQAVVLAAVMILLPLAPGIRRLKSAPRRPATLGYFLCLGVGFMLLEMGFLQKLILYLAHPIYSAAVVIAGFLIFAGLGSQLSRYWRASPRRIITRCAVAIVCLAVAYMFLLDHWLALTQGRGIWVRFAVAAATIAPPAVAMGHMFPTGLRRLADPAPALVPWAWAVNGFASVVATIGAPLLAMRVGFSRLTLIAAVCYALAGVLGRLLPCPDPAPAR